MLSAVDVVLNILDLSDEISRNIIMGINNTLLCDKLFNHRYAARTSRKLLIKSLGFNISNEIYLTIRLSKNKEGLWNQLKYCGSSICQNMFDNITIYGKHKSNHKLLTECYSREFIDLFEKLWKADKALKKLEWKLLRIGSINTEFFLNLDNNTIETIMDDKTSLIDIVLLKLFNKNIGLVLISKINDKNIDKWYELDSENCLMILVSIYDSEHDYFNNDTLTKRFINRIKSVKELTDEFSSLI